MKILFCNYEYPPLGGGGGVINALIAEEMAKRHDVTVLTSQGLDLPRERIENGVRVIRVPVFFRDQEAVASLRSMAAYIPMAIKEGLKLLRNERFDVINTHFVVPTGPVGAVLARVGRIPNILSLHGGDLYDPSKSLSPHRHLALRVAIRQLLRQANIVVGQSRNTMENMRRIYTPEIEGYRIPLAIKRPPAGVASRQQYGFAPDETLLVTVGRLVARKNIQQMIAMLNEMRHEKVRLLIVGSGPEEAFLRQEVARHQLEDKVAFMGFVEETEKFRILRMSDLYVSTSQHEGFGLVFLEAMACGIPVVCYDHGGQTDFLHEAVTGHLVPLNDLSQFQARCESLIDNPALRQEMGATNKRLVEEYFIDSCALKYERIFREAIETQTSVQQAWAFQERTV